MQEIEEDISTMVENNVIPEIPEDFVPPFPLTTEEIKKQTKQEGENFVQASLTLREEELRAADEIANEENKDIIKSVVDPMPGLLVKDEMDFQDINFPSNTTDNTYKLQPKVKKNLDEMVIDAVQPRTEQDLYIDNDFDSFMIVDDDKEVKHNDNIIDVKPKNEQIKTSVDEKIHVARPEDYINVEKSLNTTVIEISSGSEDEVSYNPGHNILELYSILVQIRFFTYKRKLDI